MLTLEQAKELLGELPKEVLEGEYYVKPFLEQIQYLIESDGEQWVRDLSYAAQPMGVRQNPLVRAMKAQKREATSPRGPHRPRNIL